ncbi:fimbrial protein [Stenotrophomonas indicatrix]|uniref:fimbrial protein n=1 Tax=Stenotrophomonas indicatrix TaxID=2045451 RepID=UPI0028AD5845|nr:fimbrial protein [Stenotrophomonas indicatrix]
MKRSFNTAASSLLLLAMAAGSAYACTATAPKIVDKDISADYVAAPLVLLGEGRDGLTRIFENCASGTVEVDLDVDFPQFTFVRMVDFQGSSYPAYQAHRSSPLFIMKYSYNNYSNHYERPLALGSSSFRIRISTNPRVAAEVIVYALSRGGGMLSLPYGELGTIKATWNGGAGVTHLTTVRMGFQLRTPTCMLSDTLVDLDPVSAEALASPSSHAGEKAFDVRMTCVASGVSLNLNLADANNAGTTGSLLSPTADSSAQGVRVQLLHGGSPVSLGREWDHGLSSYGDQYIPFSARYTRVPGDLVPGSITGQAVMTVDYN